MHTEGEFAPGSWDEARTQYETLGPTAQVVVREIARAMGFDRDEYDRRVTADVIETARQALFASLLCVTVGTAEEFEDWRADCDYEPRVVGSDFVDNVVWHDAPFAEAAVAATFQNEPEAAIGTLRRMAFNRIYREELCDA